MEWKVGDWVAFDLKVGQIKELRDGGMATFSDGFCETSGKITDRFRSLTLTSKRIVETFDIYYTRLHDINGEAGFNYPRISQHFANLALEAIDSDGKDSAPFDKANEFVSEARKYTPEIQGVELFRPKLRASR